LEIFYGPAGTGKTSRAIAENPTATRIVASATQDPSELFTRNVVNDHGGVDVVLTELGQAMVDGKPIIIDEVNLYQQCVMTRLQGATDGGKFLTDNGVNLTIKDGFKIVGTMNLETNLGKATLPDPLVSRAAKVEKMEAPYLGWVF
jgi:midasin (ATPase involved in ribosome maturation)